MGAGASVQKDFDEARAAAKATFGSKELLGKLWTTLDFNGNGIVSLAEIDKMVVWLSETDSYGGFFKGMNNKPALMRAYKRTIEREGDGDPWVEKPEFPILLRNLYLYNTLWRVFDNIDTEDDRRIDLGEFKAGIGKVGFQVDDATSEAEFAKMDQNAGGQVLFDEFCTYCMNAMEMGDDTVATFDVVESAETGDNAAAPVVEGDAAAGAPANAVVLQTLHRVVNFEEERRIAKEIFSNKETLSRLWSILDFNGNGIVSLAEIDKMVVWLSDDTGSTSAAYNGFFYGMNNKPALMRAYKRTISTEGGGDGGDYVHKKHFTILLRNLHLFNHLWQVFDSIDGDDRRIDVNEFKAGMSKLGLQLDDATAEAEYQQIDTNGGGQILFDEFCTYYCSKLELHDTAISVDFSN
jgi:Ca2+-binding EF-hand superfamily protein